MTKINFKMPQVAIADVLVKPSEIIVSFLCLEMPSVSLHYGNVLLLCKVLLGNCQVGAYSRSQGGLLSSSSFSSVNDC